MNGDRSDWDRDEREALTGLEDELHALGERRRDDPPLDLLRAARADVLPQEWQVSVDQRLAEDTWSQTLVDGVADIEPAFDADAERRLLARIQRAAAQEQAAIAPRWGWLRPALLGAGAVAAVLLVVFIARRPADIVAPPVPPSTLAVVEAPVAPPFRLAFEKPEVRLGMASLTWRGAPGESPLLADLKPALDAYRRDDYASAARELATLAGRYPDAVEVHFYRGVSRLFLDDATGAIASLDAAEHAADDTFIADVRWYRAVAAQHAGQADDARVRLDALCRRGDARGCNALSTLETATPIP